MDYIVKNWRTKYKYNLPFEEMNEEPLVMQEINSNKEK